MQGRRALILIANRIFKTASGLGFLVVFVLCKFFLNILPVDYFSMENILLSYFEINKKLKGRDASHILSTRHHISDC